MAGDREALIADFRTRLSRSTAITKIEFEDCIISVSIYNSRKPHSSERGFIQQEKQDLKRKKKVTAKLKYFESNNFK